MTTIPHPSIPLPEELSNILPLGYESWLALYDSIPERYRHDDVIFVMGNLIAVDLFTKKYGRVPKTLLKNVLVNYVFDRDFLLARCAEELLPARIEIEFLENLRRQLHLMARDPNNSSREDVDSVLNPLFSVARQ